MLGAFFILDDPIFNGLAISLIFGILVSTLLTLVVIPVLYYVAYRTAASHEFGNPSHQGELHHDHPGNSSASSPAFSSCFRSRSACRAARCSSARGGSRSPPSSALNLLQSGFTRWCPLEIILRKLGVRPGI